MCPYILLTPNLPTKQTNSLSKTINTTTALVRVSVPREGYPLKDKIEDRSNCLLNVSCCYGCQLLAESFTTVGRFKKHVTSKKKLARNLVYLTICIRMIPCGTNLNVLVGIQHIQGMHVMHTFHFILGPSAKVHNSIQ